MSRVLIASHGTVGAQAAECAALEWCKSGDNLHHIFIIADFWPDLTGDDWLNNGCVRNEYRLYLEETLYDEYKQTFLRLERSCKKRGISLDSRFVFGRTDKVFETAVQHDRYDRIFIGSRRPSGVGGIRDCLSSKKILQHYSSLLMIVAYPNECIRMAQ